MATGDKRYNWILNRIIGYDNFEDNFFDFLRDDIHNFADIVFANTGTTQLISLAADGNDKFKLTGYPAIPNIGAIDGSGYFLRPASRVADIEGVQFENAIGITYYAAMANAEIPSGLEINPKDGNPNFDLWEEVIGWSGDPDSVVVSGGGLKFVIDGVTEASVSNAGRSAIVFKKIPGENSLVVGTAIETLAVTWDSSNNIITSVAQFGQTTPSTTASDYTVVVLGPRVSRNTDLRTLTDWVFLGTVIGVGAGSPPSVFDMSDQNVMSIGISDLSDVTRYDSGSGSPKLKIDVKSYAGELTNTPQIAVTPVGGGAYVFEVNHNGDMVVNNIACSLINCTGIDSAGDIDPDANETYDLGTTSKRFKDARIKSVYSLAMNAIDVQGAGVDMGTNRGQGLFLQETVASANEKLCGFEVASAVLHCRLIDDAYSGSSVWSVGRSGSTPGTMYVWTDFAPVTSNTYTLGESTKNWKQLFLSDGAGDGVVNDLNPILGNSKDLGDSTYYWKDIFAGHIQVMTAPTVASTGAGTVKMGSGNPGTSTGWLPIKKSDGATVYIPYWATATP